MTDKWVLRFIPVRELREELGCLRLKKENTRNGLPGVLMTLIQFNKTLI
jgi:hypothetical protein